MGKTFDIDNELKNIANELKQLNVIEYNYLVIVVDNIIANNITDESLIEHTLDRILDLLFYDSKKVDALFFKLNGYYSGINKKNSDDYNLIYLESSIEEQKKYMGEHDDGYRLTREKE